MTNLNICHFLVLKTKKYNNTVYLKCFSISGLYNFFKLTLCLILSPDTNISTGEKEDIELLERALEKALQVRSASEVSEKCPNRNKRPGPRKEPGATSVPVKDVTQCSAPCKGSQTTVKSTSKYASRDRELHKKPRSSTLGASSSANNNLGLSKPINNNNRFQNRPVSSVGIVYHQAATKLTQGVSTNASLAHISTLHSKQTTVQSNSDDDLDKATTVSNPADHLGHYSHTNKSGIDRVLQHNGYVFSLYV